MPQKGAIWSYSTAYPKLFYSGSTYDIAESKSPVNRPSNPSYQKGAGTLSMCIKLETQEPGLFKSRTFAAEAWIPLLIQNKT